MKIPETSANVGAYYGNEENGQWQPNGVMVDSSGGASGGGDALRPALYPVHVPRPHGPGYVVGGYYAGAGAAYAAHAAGAAPAHAVHAAHAAHAGPQPDDFEDYMWMEHEEEFDKQVMQQLEEEALMEQCIEAMLEDEQRERARPQNGHQTPQHQATTSNGASGLSLEETVSRSTLNPLAAEFVPTKRATQDTDEKSESPAVASAEGASETGAVTETAITDAQNTQAETETPPHQDPPEVSAACLDTPRTITQRPAKDAKKPPKETKAKAKAVKSEPKIQQRRPEPRTARSDADMDDRSEDNETKPQPSPAEEPLPAGPKPINYAAAARSNKAKKPTPILTAPPEKTIPPLQKAEKAAEKKRSEKQTTPKEKPVQRKNSAK